MTPGGAGTADSDRFVLTPPETVTMVDEREAADAIPVEPGKGVELVSKAGAFVHELTSLELRSPAFAQKVMSITTMGEQDLRAASNVSSRMLDRPALTSVPGRNGGSAQTHVSDTLADLRRTITDLDPRRTDLTGVRKLLKWLPGGDTVDRYFARYQSAQSHLDAIIKALASGQDELRKDNAAIETEKATMWATMAKLREYDELAGALDVSLGERISQLEAAGRVDDAKILRSEALFPVRQRRQDITTQMAVNVQGYMALELVRKNNLELIRGVDRAQTTTIAALRTAIIVSQALSSQRLVLDQVAALNTATAELVESNAQQSRDQGEQLRQQRTTSTSEVVRLQAAFETVFATMDTLDTFRGQAVESMAQTVTALERQLERTKPYLNRSPGAENRT